MQSAEFLIASIFLATIIGLAFALRIKKKHLLEEEYETACQILVDQLDLNRFGTLTNYLDTDAFIPEDFWVASGGLPGILSRRKASWALIKLLEVNVSKGIVKSRDAEVVYRWAKYQRYYSSRALVEHYVVKFFPAWPRPAAWMAFDLHCRMTLRTWTLCRVEGAPECIFANGQVL